MEGMRLASARRTDEALAHRVALQNVSAGKHQHHDGPCQVLAQNNRGDNRNARQQIGAQLAPGHLLDELIDQKDSAESV